MKKKLIGIIICMLLVGSVLPVCGTIISNDRTSLSGQGGNTLYVGGSGEGNYSKIQDAINDSVDGDTVFVYNGTYYENLTIDKSITLLGEDRETTIIDGLGLPYFLIHILADNVIISGFTIKNTKNTKPGGYGIYIKSSNNYIQNNIISTNDKSLGIAIGDMHNTISKNIFIKNDIGIAIFADGDFTNISNNIFRDNEAGIVGSDNTIIKGNLIDGCTNSGISIQGKNCIISKNTISNQQKRGWLFSIAGVFVYGFNNHIIHNNFINNKRNAMSVNMRNKEKNIWDGNYWDDWIGFKYPQLNFLPYFSIIKQFLIDWHPAKEPYDIGI